MSVASERSIPAFDHQSSYFDQEYDERDVIYQYKRARVREILLKYAGMRRNMLELNCGTGEDAVFFNKRGFKITATDGAAGMLQRAKDKAAGTDIRFEHLPFSELQNFSPAQKYDILFSNFGGLNCTGDLENVLKHALAFLEKDGIAVLTIMPPVCPWELSYVLRLKPGMAFRRLRRRSAARIDDKHFEAWFYDRAQVRKFIQPEAEIIDAYGLCTFVPPSYMKQFPYRFKGFYKLLTFLEKRSAQYWPFNRVGDYLVYVLKKK